MIKVCPRCSSIDLDKLQESVEDTVFFGCIGKCGQHPSKCVGKIDGGTRVTETTEEFIKFAKNK